jgi:hypothetical protein
VKVIIYRLIEWSRQILFKRERERDNGKEEDDDDEGMKLKEN